MTFKLFPYIGPAFTPHSLWVSDISYDDDKQFYRFVCEEHIYDEDNKEWTYFEVRCTIKDEIGDFRKVRLSKKQYDYFTGSERWLTFASAVFHYDNSFTESKPQSHEILIEWLKNCTKMLERFFIVSSKEAEDIILPNTMGELTDKYIDNIRK